MKKMKKISIIILATIGLISCNKNNDKADGYGNFEATEITISSEANGKIEFLKVEEGDELKSQLQVGLVDTLQLHFAKQQLIASKSTVSSKSANIISQKSVLNEQLKTAKLEKNRIRNMYAENAATKRQVDEIEEKVTYSILQKRPKRADIYWFVHVNVLNEPYKKEYKVTEIVKDDIYRIDFNLGFREPTKINLMFREVIVDMVKKGEVDVTSRYESLNKNNIVGDFKFVLSEKFLSNDSDLLWHEKIIMNSYFLIKKLSLSEESAFGLDSSSVKIEKFPMVLHAPENLGLTRVK